MYEQPVCKACIFSMCVQPVCTACVRAIQPLVQYVVRQLLWPPHTKMCLGPGEDTESTERDCLVR